MSPLFRLPQRRSFVPLAALVLAAYYSLVFVPVRRHAQALDAPLQKAWRGLAAGLDQTNATEVDFGAITNQLRETRLALDRVAEARRRARPRLEIDPSLRDRMRGPFRLFEYEGERSKEIESLTSLAVQRKVTIDPAVFAGFPEHTTETRQPAMLWPALAMIDGMLHSAIACELSSIHSLEAPTGPSQGSGPRAAPGRITEIPLQMELTGSATNVDRFLRSLPLRGGELAPAGLPEVPGGKLPLFIDRVVIRRQSPEKPDETRVWLRVVGYVMGEGA